MLTIFWVDSWFLLVYILPVCQALHCQIYLAGIPQIGAVVEIGEMYLLKSAVGHSKGVPCKYE